MNSAINLGKQGRIFPGNKRPGEAKPDWSKRMRRLKRGVSKTLEGTPHYIVVVVW